MHSLLVRVVNDINVQVVNPGPQKDMFMYCPNSVRRDITFVLLAPLGVRFSKTQFSKDYVPPATETVALQGA